MAADDRPGHFWPKAGFELCLVVGGWKHLSRFCFRSRRGRVEARHGRLYGDCSDWGDERAGAAKARWSRSPTLFLSGHSDGDRREPYIRRRAVRPHGKGGVSFSQQEQAIRISRTIRCSSAPIRDGMWTCLIEGTRSMASMDCRSGEEPDAKRVVVDVSADPISMSLQRDLNSSWMPAAIRFVRDENDDPNSGCFSIPELQGKSTGVDGEGSVTDCQGGSASVLADEMISSAV